MHQFWIIGTATTLRQAVAYSLFLAGSFGVRIAIKCLPKDHPGRIYAHGRAEEGHERIGQALGKQAADRYIATRRRSSS